MFKHLSLSCFLLTMMVSTSVFAATKAGFIENPNNAFKYTKNNCTDETKKKPAKQNNSFSELDCIQTDAEGSVDLRLNNSKNNRLRIPENTVVVISEYVEQSDDGFQIKADIQKGYMGFKVEKNKGNKVDFSTGTAAASIRGTEGFIGGDSLTFMASLASGKLAIFPTGQDSLAISEGETIIGREKFIVLKLKSSGDMAFAKILSEILADTTKSIDELAAAALAADAAYQESLAERAEVAKALEDTIKVAESQRDTNTLTVPHINYYSYDSLRCVANVSLKDVQKNVETRVITVMDGTPISEINVKNSSSKRLKLQKGVHEYEFVVENTAGRNSVKKTLGCYPLKPFSVKVFGPSFVTLHIPPSPPGVEDVITQTLQFQIRIPENDPSFLNRVLVRQDGAVVLKETLSQIQNLDYQIPVELKRGHKNRFNIEFIHKSGYVVKATKVYGVD